jgi:DNA-binding transcriptional LysR family regulator
VKWIVLIGRINAMNFTTFDLNLLRVFDALMRERSATRAGQRLGLSQPAVSAALNRLRHALEDQLFVRQHNIMAPTMRALALWDPLREALERIEAAMTQIAQFEPATAQRKFTLVGSDFFSVILMPHLAETVIRAAPGIGFRYIDNGQIDPIEMLGRNDIDLAMDRPRQTPDWISRSTLINADFVVVAARGHPELAAARVSPGDAIPSTLFCSLPHALRSIDGSNAGIVDELLEKMGLKRSVVLTLPHFHAVACAVAKSRLLAALPMRFVDEVATHLDLDIYRFPFEIEPHEISLYWHRRHDRDAAHAWLRTQITSFFEADVTDPHAQAVVGRVDQTSAFAAST